MVHMALISFCWKFKKVKVLHSDNILFWLTRQTLSCLNYEYMRWYIWPWTLKDGIKFSWITFVAPNDIIGKCAKRRYWKTIIVFVEMSLKCLESGPLPETNEFSGSGGGTNGVNLTWPLAQHNPSASFLNFGTQHSLVQ